MPYGVEPDGSLLIRRFGDRLRVTTEVGTETLVQQNLADETDINRIMAKYKRTGVFTHINQAVQAYGDFSDIPDYKTGLERLQAAESTFLSLPSQLREQFGNDPANFIEFATNPDNQDKMRDMGLAPKLPPVAERLQLGAEGGNSDPKDPPKTPAKGDQ